jgi:4-hydroxy-tetrahydrodipicolinate synthase
MDKRFLGCGVAIVTPFKEQEIDFEGLSNVVNHVIAGGVDYIVALGSTGEAATISPDESKDVLDHVVKVVDKRVPIVAGNFAGIDTNHICNQIKQYDFTGIDALLISSPAYVKPSQEGIFQHYNTIAQVSPLPIILYNVPGRTKSNMEWQTVIKLANASSKFVGIKEASGDMIQANKILHNRPDNFFMVSGDDETALALVALGGDGVISVIANAFPASFSKMINSARKGDLETARELNKETYKLHQHLYAEGNPTGIKSATKALGLCGNEVRLPLTKMSDDGYKLLIEEVKNITNVR